MNILFVCLLKIHDLAHSDVLMRNMDSAVAVIRCIHCLLINARAKLRKIAVRCEFMFPIETEFTGPTVLWTIGEHLLLRFMPASSPLELLLMLVIFRWKTPLQLHGTQSLIVSSGLIFVTNVSTVPHEMERT